jgi:hypothetical protein
VEERTRLMKNLESEHMELKNLAAEVEALEMNSTAGRKK